MNLLVRGVIETTGKVALTSFKEGEVPFAEERGKRASAVNEKGLHLPRKEGKAPRR
ncbi:hypothetical protein [Bacillus sp. ISL-77]|uniref:hypothetical protein n=1 Tax=Bacillus sp. ISL-77 TaxID=2819138 RepID=UPI001BEB6EB9|nr:hypothetical protein [Bacillus sp. ISL-77]MBT2742938.1 hypothetical protein [Bacillus sp. ISL-77]